MMGSRSLLHTTGLFLRFSDEYFCMPDEGEVAGSRQQWEGVAKRNLSHQNRKWMGRSSHRSSGFTCPPSVLLVIVVRRLLQGKAPVKRERASSRSHKPVLEWSFHKGRPGERLLHRLRFDESEVIDPQ